MRLLLLVLFSFTLSGCSWFTTVEYVDKYVYVTKYRTISSEYLQYCPIVEPPQVERYTKSNYDQRISMWMNTYIEQLESTRLRNLKMDELIKLNQYLTEQHNESKDTDTLSK